jgi:hypothetical protein
LSDTLRPLQAKRSGGRASNGFGYIGSEEPLIVVGTGSAVSPVSPLLVCAKSVTDRSDDRATLRRSKAFPSLVGLGLATAPALVVHCQETSGQGSPDAPTGVSGHRGFRSASHLGGYGTLLTSRRY